MDRVIDYSKERTDFDAMRSAGVIGVMRYLAPLPNGKVITSGEYRRLKGAGFEVGLIWESSGSRSNQGHSAGREDGAAAAEQATALGYPVDHYVYWAVDHEPVGRDIEHALDYGRAFAEACSFRARPYGNDAVVNAVVEAGIADGGWQCRAWSGKPIRYSSHRVLFQWDGHGPLDLEGSYDTDDIHRDDWASTAGAAGLTLPKEPEPSMLVQHPDGHLEMFDVADQKLVQNWQLGAKSGKWSGWVTMDDAHTYTKMRGAVQGRDGNINVIVKATDGDWAFWFDQHLQEWMGPVKVSHGRR